MSLRRWGRWYVFGAQAVIAYGVPRLSADVDVTLALAPDDPAGFAREMAAAGFVLRVDDPDFVRRTRVLPFVHESTGMPLDVVLADSGACGSGAFILAVPRNCRQFEDCARSAADLRARRDAERRAAGGGARRSGTAAKIAVAVTDTH